MIKCEKCGKQTRCKEPTAKFTTFRKKNYDLGKYGKEAVSELKVCINCSGVKDE